MARLENLMETIVNLCKRRGFVFQSSEIYNGYSGFWDYGPLGVELRNNLKQRWWRDMVHRREDVVGLDTSIIASPAVWRASGHVDGFSDPMVDCRESNNRYRADQLFFGPVTASASSSTGGEKGGEGEGRLIGYVAVGEASGKEMESAARDAARRLRKRLGLKGAEVRAPKLDELREVTEASEEQLALMASPATGTLGALTPPRDFNLMFETAVGAVSGGVEKGGDSNNKAYLRPETAQGIFLDMKQVASTGRLKVPFGVAQIGKAFRNEITPRNFIFRSREFEQMEIEYFIPPGDDEWPRRHAEWLEASWQWLLDIGVREDLLGRDVHPPDGLAHYARACTDITFRFPFGERELQGVAARGDYDLRCHQEASGKPLELFDEVRKVKYLPHVIEPSIGVDRLFLAVICSAHCEDVVDGEARSVLKFHPSIAPIKAAVLPLLKNKPELVGVGRELFEKLQRRYNVAWDASGAIGRRYRRMDEVGTPFCLTVDFQTLEDGTVTLRDRDTTEQRRLAMDDVPNFLSREIDGF